MVIMFHIYGVRFDSEKEGVITIFTSTSHGEHFTIENGLEGVGVEKTIAGKKENIMNLNLGFVMLIMEYQ